MPALLGVGDDLPGVVEGRRQRLLADHVDAQLAGHSAHLEVGVGRRDHVDEVGPFCVEHFPIVGVVSRDAVLVWIAWARSALRLHIAVIVDLGDPVPGFVLKLAEIAGPDTDAFELRHQYSSNGLSGRIIIQAATAKTFSRRPSGNRASSIPVHFSQVGEGQRGGEGGQVARHVHRAGDGAGVLRPMSMQNAQEGLSVMSAPKMATERNTA